MSHDQEIAMSRSPRRKLLRRVIPAALIFGVLLAGWALVIEPAGFRTRDEVVLVPTWPLPCDGLRIAVLADLHVGSPYKGLATLEDIVSKVNAVGPDLVLLPGDFVIQGVLGGTFVPPEDAARVLSRLDAPAGVFAVLGNHDWWFDRQRVESAFVDHGIRVLEDASEAIRSGDCTLRLVGISDYWEGPHDVDRALENVAPGEAILAFTHNPDIFPQLPSRIALTIAGHTHGGQVYIPGIGRPIVPSDYGERLAIGHIEENGKHLFVSPGVGTSIIPVRFLVPPEATILEVRRGN